MECKKFGVPYSIKYIAIIFVIYQRVKVQYFCYKNVITLVRTQKGHKVDWAQIIFNSLCSELDRWYNMLMRIKRIKKIPINLPW
jgi:hypothetical protein